MLLLPKEAAALASKWHSTAGTDRCENTGAQEAVVLPAICLELGVVFL